jgi:hypothetical protein
VRHCPPVLPLSVKLLATQLCELDVLLAGHSYPGAGPWPRTALPFYSATIRTAFLMQLGYHLLLLSVCSACRTFPSWCWTSLAMNCCTSCGATVCTAVRLQHNHGLTLLPILHCLQDIPILVLGHHYVSHRQLGEQQRCSSSSHATDSCSPSNAVKVLNLSLPLADLHCTC